MHTVMLQIVWLLPLMLLSVLFVAIRSHTLSLMLLLEFWSTGSIDKQSSIMRRTASWVKKVGRGGRKLQFSDWQLHISHRKIMGAQKLNVASKFTQNGGLSAPNFVFLEANFPTIKFSERLNLGREIAAPLPPATTPLRTYKSHNKRSN